MVLRFPWKKKGKTRIRISEFVKLQFRRRKNAASPLVVETVFPTSLVDLILNYRDRFQIPPPPSPPLRSKKKTPPPRPPLIVDPVSISPPQPPPPPPGQLEIQARSRRGGLKPNGVSLVAFKVFLICVLAMCTKKLALAITISAFLLFFLEFLVNHLSRFLRIWSNPRATIVSTVFNDPSLPESLSDVESDDRSSIIPEIKIERKLECEGERLKDMMEKDGCGKPHKAKIFKTKMKKILLPKKLRKKLEEKFKKLGN